MAACASGKALISWGNSQIQKCAHRLSPIDDDCHIKYINIHRYASRLLGLFLNCSNATHQVADSLSAVEHTHYSNIICFDNKLE